MANATSGSALDETRNWMVIVVLLVVPVVGTFGFLLWELHTPNPRVKTPIPINRNSLLPHRFAGVCENCHRVIEVGPVDMNKDNMRLFNLSSEQRQLLLAGQRVEAPSLLQRIRVPAISRSDDLPHPYVGVCSNCHVILDVKPAPQVAQRAMQRAYQPLLATNMSRERIAHGGMRERESREFLRNVFGFIALGLFLLSSVYIAMRFLMKSYPQLVKGKLRIKPWFTVHEWSSTAFCIAAILHWYFSDRGNNLLHIALLITIWLTVAGYVLRYRVAHKETNKSVRLLHTQRWLFVALVVLLVVGHLFAEFH
jgi:nitrate reductase NapE component